MKYASRVLLFFLFPYSYSDSDSDSDSDSVFLLFFSFQEEKGIRRWNYGQLNIIRFNNISYVIIYGRMKKVFCFLLYIIPKETLYCSSFFTHTNTPSTPQTPAYTSNHTLRNILYQKKQRKLLSSPCRRRQRFLVQSPQVRLEVRAQVYEIQHLRRLDGKFRTGLLVT